MVTPCSSEYWRTRPSAPPTHAAVVGWLDASRSALLDPDRYDLPRRSEISEFYGLCIQALLAITEGSRFATDYIEMAEAVAATRHEHAVVAETRIACEWLQDRSGVAPPWMHATLAQPCEDMAPWNEVLVALCRLGELETSIRREVLDPRAA